MGNILMRNKMFHMKQFIYRKNIGRMKPWETERKVYGF